MSRFRLEAINDRYEQVRFHENGNSILHLAANPGQAPVIQDNNNPEYRDAPNADATIPPHNIKTVRLY